jgi:hypothetical protein
MTALCGDGKSPNRTTALPSSNKPLKNDIRQHQHKDTAKIDGSIGFQVQSSCAKRKKKEKEKEWKPSRFIGSSLGRVVQCDRGKVIQLSSGAVGRSSAGKDGENRKTAKPGTQESQASEEDLKGRKKWNEMASFCGISTSHFLSTRTPIHFHFHSHSHSDFTPVQFF